MPRQLRADIEARQAQVAAGLLARKSERAIARELGVGRSTINRDVAVVRAEWRDRRFADVDVVIGEELATLVEAQRAIWPRVLAGHNLSIDRLLAIMDRRAKLLGLDHDMRAAPPAAGPQVTVVILHGRTHADETDDAIDPRSLAASWRAQPALHAG